MIVKGVTGEVEFDGRTVVIRRGRLMGRGEKRIPVGQISGIEMKPPGITSRGFIQFTIPGGPELKSRAGSRSIDAAKDENSVLFSRKQQADFERLRDEIEAAIAG